MVPSNSLTLDFVESYQQNLAIMRAAQHNETMGTITQQAVYAAVVIVVAAAAAAAVVAAAAAAAAAAAGVVVQL